MSRLEDTRGEAPDAPDVRDLVAEVERLRAELARRDEDLAKANRLRARVAGFATGSAVRVLLSGPLVDSIETWIRARSLRDPVPPRETAEVMAAIVRRVIRVGLVGLAVASLPMVVLVWQGFMMRAQNTHMRTQNETIQRQFERQGRGYADRADGTAARDDLRL